MENRWGSRKLSGINAILDFRPVGLVRGTIRNFSLSGVYIQTDNAAIPANKSTTLVFLMPDDPVARIQRVHVQVVRQDKNGLGLMFNDAEQNTLQTLQGMQKQAYSDRAVHGDREKTPIFRSDSKPARTTTIS
jgi:hypothetical protein